MLAFPSLRVACGSIGVSSRAFASKPKPWGRQPDTNSFHKSYPTVFRPSSIPNAGLGWWSEVDIPANTVLRRVTLNEGSLIRIGSEEELRATGWDIAESVHYGIGHKKDPDAIFFLSPGTPCNHADPSREVSVRYSHDETGAYELVTTKDVKAGEEMLVNYTDDYGPCKWYDDNMQQLGKIPLSQLGEIINNAE